MAVDFERENAQQRRTNRQTYVFNAAYGLVAGTAFALAMWGRDAVALSQAHAFFPWQKLILGVVLCGLVGVICGLVTARRDGGCLTVGIWVAGAAGLGWITVGLPLQIMPIISENLEPELAGLLNYSVGQEFVVRFWIAFGWTAVFMAICGLLQQTLVDSSIAGINAFAKTLPLSIAVILMAIGGVLLDGLVNEPFREAIHSLAAPIDFILEHQGESISREDAREYRTTAFRSVQELVSEERSLIVRQYDESFGRVDVLIQFETGWVQCTTVYRQPTFCKIAEREAY